VQELLILERLQHEDVLQILSRYADGCNEMRRGKMSQFLLYKEQDVLYLNDRILSHLLQTMNQLKKM
jgi:hypothetical protein